MTDHQKTIKEIREFVEEQHEILEKQRREMDMITEISKKYGRDPLKNESWIVMAHAQTNTKPILNKLLSIIKRNEEKSKLSLREQHGFEPLPERESRFIETDDDDY